MGVLLGALRGHDARLATAAADNIWHIIDHLLKRCSRAQGPLAVLRRSLEVAVQLPGRC